ncbi:LysE family translocator [Stutzerimonas nosocomialis]|uniref:LysE family translocator n=1 Tax=Stutzerimonas nosocomialis TaxID=1056496 RepID=A0A5R9QBI5_9GAMM|nr:LysE family translocator [Stutzerimonas nosocomialis]TLX62258.1 LysE family translocator [Stutzerimonas nosocomialis]
MENLGMFVLALAVVLLLPGPDMLLLLQTGARAGRSRALSTAAGLAVARSGHVAFAAMGLASLFMAVPWTFDAVRLLGAGYLLWLGLGMFRAEARALSVDGAGGASLSLGAAFRQGVLTNLLNPKALLFCSLLLPQFIDAGAGPVASQFAVLGVTLVLVGLLFDTSYALAGALIGRWLEQSPALQRAQQRLFGALLIGFALRLALVSQV